MNNGMPSLRATIRRSNSADTRLSSTTCEAILTCRTGFEPRLAEQPHVLRLNLGRLHPDDSLQAADLQLML